MKKETEYLVQTKRRKGDGKYVPPWFNRSCPFDSLREAKAELCMERENWTGRKHRLVKIVTTETRTVLKG